MKRFLCACLDGPPREVPEVKAWLQQGCPRQAAYGSLYCKEDDALMDSIEEEDSAEVGNILKHRATETGDI